MCRRIDSAPRPLDPPGQAGDTSAMPTATLYGIPASHALYATTLMLRAKGVPYRRIDLPQWFHRRMPPLLIQPATDDPYCPESQALATRAREHGAHARLELYQVATHVSQVFWSFLPEATEALESAGRFVQQACAEPRLEATGG